MVPRRIGNGEAGHSSPAKTDRQMTFRPRSNRFTDKARTSFGDRSSAPDYSPGRQRRAKAKVPRAEK
jgi:hypothetical protein